MGISSPLRPFTNYDHSAELQTNTVELWWTVNNTEETVTFELHVKTVGWIAFGISPGGGMKGADIAVGWVDSSGKVYIQDRFAHDKIKPDMDNTTQDWIALKGQEQNGWTALQFKRSFDTCDSMDVPIRSGTNIVIFAYGLVDLDLCHSNVDMTYHEDRRGTRMLPLLSYKDPPTDDMFAKNDFFDLRFDNHAVPSTDTTYYCKIFKSPSRFTKKRHAIARKVLIDSRNVNLVHHLDLFECGPEDIFNNTQLPDGICDDLLTKMRMCSSKLATAWAIGGDLITEYTIEAGYPVSNDVGDKYFMIKMHYDNPQLTPNLRDSSGVRFYLGDELRQHDLGYLVFGTLSRAAALAIPPKTKQFIVDSYCPPEATRNFPSSGINILSALPHTHLQGVSVWTKLIRNNTAVQYLFNAEAYDFNYQFENRLSEPIKIYPGDSFATRCVYSTTNKNEITLGGQRTTDEMCSHTFSYYPAVDGLSACMIAIDEKEWQTFMSAPSPIDNMQLQQWLLNFTWTPESVARLQEFYNKANRYTLFDRQGQFEFNTLPANLNYKDLQVEPCNKKELEHSIDQSCSELSGSTACQHTLFIFTLIFFVLKTIFP
ncbi:unnamed protein product [Adineta steineri]|uniref:DOMON domain-containing protein n=1 Tax=Adineta steineri TaxID=433720 RepID=A0A819P8T6_9BILA|nr:unnamed protein product [Adineta steineri]